MKSVKDLKSFLPADVVKDAEAKGIDLQKLLDLFGPLILAVLQRLLGVRVFKSAVPLADNHDPAACCDAAIDALAAATAAVYQCRCCCEAGAGSTPPTP